MKKVISLLLAIVMVIGLLPTAAFAAETDPAISFETTFEDTMTVGDTFTVTASLANNPGMATMTLSLKWNEDAVKFNGFATEYDEDMEEDILVTDVFKTVWEPVVNYELGIIVAARAKDTKKEGTLFVANFEVVGSGELGIGLKDTDRTEFEMVNAAMEVIEPTIDYSAIENLSVAAPEAEDPAIPDGAPFTAVTTTDGANVIAIKKVEEITIDSDYGSYSGMLYKITIPEGAEGIKATFPIPTTDMVFTYADDMTEILGVSGYAADFDEYEGEITAAGSYNGIHFAYTESNGNTTVEIPALIEGSSWMGNYSHNLIREGDSENGYYYAVAGPEYNVSYAPICFFTFEYGTVSGSGEEEETHSITVEQTTGGTVTVYDVNGENEITKAAAGDYLFLENQADTGYTFKHYLINGDVVTQDALGMNNGFYTMPAADITVSAVFEEVAPEIEPNPITEIEVSHPNIEVDETTGAMSMAMVSGASEQIDMRFAVADEELAATQVVAWFSSDETVATVVNGKVTALKAGSTVITAKAVEASGIALLADGEEVLAQFTLTVADPSTGYTVNMGADKTVVADETIQIPVTVTHSDSNVTDYKSFEFTFQYDPTVLTLVTGSSDTEGKEITVIDNNGTVTVRRYGGALSVGTAAITLEFTANKTGKANVKLTSAKVGTTADAQGENIPTAQVVDDITLITVTGYTVSLPQDFAGETVVAPGESYTFEAKDKNYTYEVTATVNGEAITVTPNEDGTSFTIPEGEIDGNVVIEIAKKEGKKFEITLNGDSLAHESGYTTEGEKTYAQYMTPYTAKLTEKDHYIYELKVTVNGETIAHDYNGETGIITIAGNLITGPVVIDSGEQESDKHDVTFEGTYASHAKYEGESAVYDGENFSFTIETPEGFTIQSYEVSYKMGDATEYTALEAVEDTYTIEDITAALTIKIEGTSDLKVEVNEYVKLNGKVVFLVTATQTLPEGKNLAYNSDVMYLKNFTVDGSDTMALMYSYLVVVNSGETLSVEDAAAMITIVEAQATTLADTFNVNESTALDINDAQLVYDLYNNVYQDIDIVGMQKFLRADVNGSRNINVSDAAAVVNAILAENQ